MELLSIGKFAKMILNVKQNVKTILMNSLIE